MPECSFSRLLTGSQIAIDQTGWGEYVHAMSLLCKAYRLYDKSLSRLPLPFRILLITLLAIVFLCLLFWDIALHSIVVLP